jgi:hypothetical protein
MTAEAAAAEALQHQDKKKKKRRRPRPVPAAERAASTREEFCLGHRISRSKYYELKKRGEAPDEMIVDGKHLISNESAARWRKQRTAASKKLGIPLKGAQAKAAAKTDAKADATKTKAA